MEKIYTLRDLDSMRLAKKPLAVFGKPIGHSLSPLMQNAALSEMAKTEPEFAEWHYYKFEIDPCELGVALERFYDKGFVGVNLTIPHKEIVFGFLKGADDFSRLAGAANTLSRTEGGWKGTNTDGFGLAKAVKNFSGRMFKNADVVIFGAGGASRAACFEVLQRGCKSLQISNRTKLKREKLIAEIRAAGFEASELLAIPEGAIIINATSVGLHGGDGPIADFSKVSKDCIFFDMPYIRGKETPSVIAARSFGIKAASGLDMLAWQGAKALSIWTNRPMMGDLMGKVLREAQK